MHQLGGEANSYSNKIFGVSDINWFTKPPPTMI